MFLDECTDKEIKDAAMRLFNSNEEHHECWVEEPEVNRQLGVVILSVTESKEGPIWEEVISFEDVSPFIKIDEKDYE